MNTTTDPFAHVPFPAGAIRVYEWADPVTPDASRYFLGDQWVIERRNRDDDVEVYVAGLQYADGSVAREIVVHQLQPTSRSPSGRPASWPVR